MVLLSSGRGPGVLGRAFGGTRTSTLSQQLAFYSCVSAISNPPDVGFVDMHVDLDVIFV